MSIEKRLMEVWRREAIAAADGIMGEASPDGEALFSAGFLQGLCLALSSPSIAQRLQQTFMAAYFPTGSTSRDESIRELVQAFEEVLA